MEAHNHIGVRDLRAELATYLKRAEAGDRLIVTVDGRPIAQIGPLEPSGEPTLEDLIALGLVKRPKNETKPPKVRPAQTPHFVGPPGKPTTLVVCDPRGQA